MIVLVFKEVQFANESASDGLVYYALEFVLPQSLLHRATPASKDRRLKAEIRSTKGIIVI